MKLKYVQRIDAPAGKGGGVYYYFRPTRQRFAAAFGTPAFAVEYEALLEKWRGTARAKPGTIGSLIAAYRAAPEFQQLAADTRIGYQRAFDALKPMHGMPLPLVDQPTVLGIRDRIFKSRKRRMANYVLQVLSVVFAWGMPRQLIGLNPARGVPKIKRPRKKPIANRPWRPSEFRVAVTSADIGPATAIFLGRFAMLRITDCIAVNWEQYDGRTIRLIASKTGKEVEIIVSAPLRRQLDKARAAELKRAHLGADAVLAGPIVRNRFGAAYTRSGLQSVLHRLIRDMEKRRLAHPGLTHHGLRKGMASELSELGIDERALGGAMGENPESTRVYTEPANRKILGRRAFAVIEAMPDEDSDDEQENETA